MKIHSHVVAALTVVARTPLTMRRTRKALAALVMFSVATALVGGPPARGQEVSPPWAYVLNPPDFKPSPDDGTLRRVPNSSAAFTLTQLRDLFFAPDWHPEDHPAMPPIVSQGRPTK